MLPRRQLVRFFAAFWLITAPLCVAPLFGQSNSGELRIKVTDPSGLGVRSDVVLVSEANEFRKTLSTDDSGALVVKRMPFGVYRVQIAHAGFSGFARFHGGSLRDSADYAGRLAIAAPNSSVAVNDSDTLIDPHRTGDINRIGSEAVASREFVARDALCRIW